MAKGFKVADAYVELTLDRDELRKDAAKIPGDLGPEMDRAGGKLGEKLGGGLVRDASGKLRNAKGQFATDAEKMLAGIDPVAEKRGNESGGKLAIGMRMAFLRNSPLIVAAIGGALAAGAPVMLAAATGLFAGVGIVAAAQSGKVQAAWVGTWDHVRQSAIDSAAVIEPVLVKVATQVGAAFDQMRPKLDQAFAAAGPQIEVFTQGIIKLAQNAMPGLVRAVEQGMPVTKGLAEFLAKVGTGLSDFFDRLTAHAPEAGSAFSSLGDSFAKILPMLGEILGQGAELASVMLPLLSGSLGLVLSVVTALGPALPAVVAGFTAMKIVGTLGGLFDTLGGKLKSIGGYLGLISTGPGSATAASSSLASLKGAVGPLTAVVALAGAAFMAAQQQIDDWARALLAGGNAASQARTQMAAQEGYFDSTLGKINNLVSGTTNWANALGVGSNASETAAAKAKELLNAMSPLEQAQQRVTQATNYLNEVQDKYGPSSDQAAGASRALKSAQNELERQEGALQQAIEGVTDAMIAQANQAMASIDSGFAYRDAVNQLEDAQNALAEAQAHVNDTNKDTQTSAEDVQRAQLAVEEQTYRTAEAFGKQQADLSGLEEGTNAYNRVVQEQTLGALIELQKQAGPGMAAAIGQQIAALQAGGVNMSSNSAQASALAAQVRNLGIAVTQVPGQKYVQIDAPTAAQIAQLEALGYTVRTLPNGTVYVYASGVAAVENAINYAARSRTATVYLRQVGAALADGGPVHPIIKAAGGRIVGPGGPTEDKVPAIGPGGAPWALSNGEYVIRASSVNKYGPAAMAAVNSGTAVVSAPQGASPSGGVTVQSLNVNLSGTWDFASPRAARAVAEKVRDALINLEREQQ